MTDEKKAEQEERKTLVDVSELISDLKIFGKEVNRRVEELKEGSNILILKDDKSGVALELHGSLSSIPILIGHVKRIKSEICDNKTDGKRNYLG